MPGNSGKSSSVAIREAEIRVQFLIDRAAVLLTIPAMLRRAARYGTALALLAYFGWAAVGSVFAGEHFHSSSDGVRIHRHDHHSLSSHTQAHKKQSGIVCHAATCDPIPRQAGSLLDLIAGEALANRTLVFPQPVIDAGDCICCDTQPQLRSDSQTFPSHTERSGPLLPRQAAHCLTLPRPPPAL